jgi:competence protein ComEA
MKYRLCTISVSLALWLLLCVPAFAQTVDINTADAAELAEALEGVGDKKAAAIVEYREANGGFVSVDELTAVSGIGEKTVEANRDVMTLGESP